MTKFQGTVAAMLLLSAFMACVSSAMAEPPLLARRILGTAADLDVEEESARRVLTSASQFGGNGGGAFSDGIHSNVLNLVFRCGDALDQIRTKYTDGSSYNHGGSGGSDVPISFNFQNPVTLTVFSGPKPDEGLSNIIRGISIQQGGVVKNCGLTSVVAGGSAGTLGNIILRGFYGKSGRYIDQLGVFYN